MPLLPLEELLMYMKPPGPKVSVDFAGMCFIQHGALSQDGNEWRARVCVQKTPTARWYAPKKRISGCILHIDDRSFFWHARWVVEFCVHTKDDSLKNKNDSYDGPVITSYRMIDASKIFSWIQEPWDYFLP